MFGVGCGGGCIDVITFGCGAEGSCGNVAGAKGLKVRFSGGGDTGLIMPPLSAELSSEVFCPGTVTLSGAGVVRLLGEVVFCVIVVLVRLAGSERKGFGKPNESRVPRSEGSGMDRVWLTVVPEKENVASFGSLNT